MVMHQRMSRAMVYPCLLAAISDTTDPSWRARALSVYRFWQDLDHAVGALTARLLTVIVGFARIMRQLACLRSSQV
jgi:hypothetical protein